MIAYRIADARHPIFDPTVAMLHGGRWNSVGARVIYAAETYAGALLEILAHANVSQPPKNHRVVRIEIPAGVKIEPVVQEQVPGWDAEDARASRTHGDEWIRSRRTAVLQVQSVITQGREYNLVLNTEHPDLKMIQAGALETVHWDDEVSPLFVPPLFCPASVPVETQFLNLIVGLPTQSAFMDSSPENSRRGTYDQIEDECLVRLLQLAEGIGAPQDFDFCPL